MLIDNKFKIGQEVYIKTDIDQKKRIVTSIIISRNEIQYQLSCGVESSWCYDFEISKEIDILAQYEIG